MITIIFITKNRTPNEAPLKPFTLCRVTTIITKNVRTKTFIRATGSPILYASMFELSNWSLQYVIRHVLVSLIFIKTNQSRTWRYPQYMLRSAAALPPTASFVSTATCGRGNAQPASSWSRQACCQTSTAEILTSAQNHVIAVTSDFQACIEDGNVLQIVQQRTLAATAALTLD